MIFWLIVVFFIIALLEIPNLIKNKYWKEIKVFSVLLLAAFILSLFYIIDLPIPNPTKWAEYIVKNVLHLNYR